MKTVEFTKDMRPRRRGDNVPLPDEVADRLVASGEAINPRPFPENAPATEAPKKSRFSLPGRGTYQTKARP